MAATGILTGVLESGDAIQNNFVRDFGAMIVLVPEPVPTFLLATALLSLTALRRMRRAGCELVDELADRQRGAQCAPRS